MPGYVSRLGVELGIKLDLCESRPKDLPRTTIDGFGRLDSVTKDLDLIVILPASHRLHHDGEIRDLDFTHEP